MLGKLLDYGSVFDWISPTLSIAQDIANGPSHTFLIPVECGWTGREIAGLLHRRGIKTWGHMIVNGTIMITVREPQAEFATHLLESAGLPVDGPHGSKGKGTRTTTTKHGLGDLLREIGNIRL